MPRLVKGCTERRMGLLDDIKARGLLAQSTDIAALEEAPSDEFVDMLKENADNSDSEEEKRIWEAMVDYINYFLH